MSLQPEESDVKEEPGQLKLVEKCEYVNQSNDEISFEEIPAINHFGYEQYQCYKCQHCALNKEDFLNHIKEVHPEKELLNCSQCNYRAGLHLGTDVCAEILRRTHCSSHQSDRFASGEFRHRLPGTSVARSTAGGRLHGLRGRDDAARRLRHRPRDELHRGPGDPQQRGAGARRGREGDAARQDRLERLGVQVEPVQAEVGADPAGVPEDRVAAHERGVSMNDASPANRAVLEGYTFFETDSWYAAEYGEDRQSYDVSVLEARLSAIHRSRRSWTVS